MVMVEAASAPVVVAIVPFEATGTSELAAG